VATSSFDRALGISNTQVMFLLTQVEQDGCSAKHLIFDLEASQQMAELGQEPDTYLEQEMHAFLLGLGGLRCLSCTCICRVSVSLPEISVCSPSWMGSPWVTYLRSNVRAHNEQRYLSDRSALNPPIAHPRPHTDHTCDQHRPRLSFLKLSTPWL
jgi:hypothetical protein